VPPAVLLCSGVEAEAAAMRNFVFFVIGAVEQNERGFAELCSRSLLE
jgi:hypothetical protein